jgi:hypothetical protein
MSVSATSSVVRGTSPAQSQFVSAKSDHKQRAGSAAATQQSAFVKATPSGSGEIGGKIDVKL